MRKLITSLGVAAAITAAAYACDLPPLASPTFYEKGRKVFFCEGSGGVLPITFSDDGLIAVVEIGSSRTSLHFDRSAFEDTYKADGWVLQLDPDTLLLGPNGIRRSNCS